MKQNPHVKEVMRDTQAGICGPLKETIAAKNSSTQQYNESIRDTPSVRKRTVADIKQ